MDLHIDGPTVPRGRRHLGNRFRGGIGPRRDPAPGRSGEEHPVDEALERVMVEDAGLDIALRRPGQPEEVGARIAFLLSPVAGYITGALVNIDGGTNF
jgi:NAD(P)-dependent dehydrogenase (short-subunit alcohol dehydrogenase family)